MKITLTGSLGNVGEPLAKKLVNQEHVVTVISSTPERQEEIEAIGAQAAIGSIEDATFLTEAFTDVDAVYCMIPANYFGEPDIPAYYERIGQNFAQVIDQAKINRVVHLSSFGAHLPKDTGPIAGSHRVEKILNGLSNISLTHIRPGSFYYNLYGYIDMIKDRGSIMANYGADEFPLVAPKDIAAAVAEELQKTTDVQPIRYVASDECTGSEIASVLGEAIGKPNLQWKIISDEEVQKGLIASGMPDHISDSLIELNASIRTGKLAEDYKKHKPDLNGKVKLEDFAKEFAAAFEKA